METFEQRIASVVNEKLNDGTIEELVEKYLEKGVSDALGDIFSYSGDGRRMIQKKLNEVMIPLVEHHDFNQYLVKLDSVLTEIVNKTTLVENRRILSNFAELMKEPDAKEIELSEIFEKYCEHVAKNVDTDNLEAMCEDGEPYYEYVTARMEVEHEDKSWLKSNFEDCVVKLTCDQDESLNCQIKLYKRIGEDDWRMLMPREFVDISSLRYLNEFKIMIMKLNRANVKIIMDEENAWNSDIEPKAKPEWSLS